MTRELEIQFQERAINALLLQMNEIFHLLRSPKNEHPFVDIDFSAKEIVAEKKREFNMLAQRVYNMSLVYLEMKNVPQYIRKFEDTISPLYKDMKKLASLSTTNIYEEVESVLITEYRQILYPFRAFGGGDEKNLTRLDVLENILNNTAFILNEKNVRPKKEVDVYSNVKVVCESSFSGDVKSIGGYEPFNHLAKCYKPDILIPYLNCAIEYKFAKTEKDLINTIDQILIDVPGYSNHNVYKLFYAVFYVKSGIIPKTKFSQIWNSKGFPENWKEIFVEGPV